MDSEIALIIQRQENKNNLLFLCMENISILFQKGNGEGSVMPFISPELMVGYVPNIYYQASVFMIGTPGDKVW